MKKVIRCLGMVALMALAFTSCKKNEEQTRFTATMPQLVVEDEDRAYIDNNLKVHFEIGDRVMIFNISVDSAEMSHCATYKAIEDGPKVEFVNSGMGTVGVALDGGYYAYYPSTLVQDPEDEWGFVSDRIETELEQGENKSKFYVSPVQQYRPGKVARKDFYLAGHTTQAEAPNLNEANFPMKFICGVFQFKPFEAAGRTITSVEVIDNTFHLSGWMELIVPEVDYDEMKGMCDDFNPNNPTYMANLMAYKERLGYNVTDAGYSVTMDIPEGVQLATSKAAAKNTNGYGFNIVLRPWACAFGFHVIVTYSDGSVKDIDLSSFTGLRIKPNVVSTVYLNLDNF